MLKKWRIKRERQLLQEFCPHEWHETSNYNSFTSAYSSNTTTFHDIYCPLCETTRKNIRKREFDGLLAIQKIRKQYADEQKIY